MFPSRAKGWVVAIAGLGINTAAGVICSWPAIAASVTTPAEAGGWGWSWARADTPLLVAMAAFATSMVLGGLWQDRLGARPVVTAGGALCGLGLVVASLATAHVAWPAIVGFGVLAGAGAGLCFSAVTPAAVRWFPPGQKGRIIGVVVAGSAIAGACMTPLTSVLIDGFGVSTTLQMLGVASLCTILLLARLLAAPPADGTTPAGSRAEYGWREMVRTRQFPLLWLMNALAAVAVWMIAGSIAKVAGGRLPIGTDADFTLLAVLAAGDTLGRVVAGVLADRIGGVRSMRGFFVVHAGLIIALATASTSVVLIPLVAGVGFCSGAYLSLFPSTTAGFFGTRNLGVNYGLVFTAWGAGGLLGLAAARTLIAYSGGGGHFIACGVASALLVLAAAITLRTKAPPPKVAAHPVAMPAAIPPR